MIFVIAILLFIIACSVAPDIMAAIISFIVGLFILAVAGIFLLVVMQ